MTYDHRYGHAQALADDDDDGSAKEEVEAFYLQVYM